MIKNKNVGAGLAFGKSEELIVNNEEYKCFAFDVGAGSVSDQENINNTIKPNANRLRFNM